MLIPPAMQILKNLLRSYVFFRLMVFWDVWTGRISKEARRIGQLLIAGIGADALRQC
jgi:hypothetical protein